MHRGTFWSFLLGAALLGLSSGCSDESPSSGGPAEETPKEKTDPSEDPKETRSLRLDWKGARAVAIGNVTEAAPNALTLEQQMLFRIEEDGSVAPALEGPLTLQLPEVQFVARSPQGDVAYVSFRSPLVLPAEDTEEASEPEVLGTFFRVDEDGTMTSLIDPVGRVHAPRVDRLRADVSEAFQQTAPYHFDADGNLYVIWAASSEDNAPGRRLLHRYRAADDELDVVGFSEEEIVRLSSAVLSGDGSTLVVSGERSYPDDLTDAGVPRRQSFVQLYRLPDLDAPVDVVTPEDELAWIGGTQVSMAGDSVFFHGYLLGDLSGIGRADVSEDGEVTSTLLCGMMSAFAPINHSTTHDGDYVDGFFERTLPDAEEPGDLIWADRWFVGGDPSSGELDYDAVLGHVETLFTAPVTFSYDGQTGSEALEGFLADGPYPWEAIQGGPMPETFESIYDDYYGWHFLEEYFVDAATGDAATTVAAFLEQHDLAQKEFAYYQLDVREIFFDKDGALFALVRSDWDIETQRFGRMQLLRILDASGERALAVLPALAEAEFTVEAYRLGKDGQHVFVLARLPGEDEEGSTHRIYRLDPSLGDDAVLEDMMGSVPGDEHSIADFSVSKDHLYFVGETGSGVIDLETLEFAPIDGVELASIQAL